MTDTLPSELLDCGWKIVHQDDNMTIIETIISGKAVRGVGKDLAHAVADAEAFLKRLDEYGSFARSAFGNPASGKAPVEGTPDDGLEPADFVEPTEFLDEVHRANHDVKAGRDALEIDVQ